MAIGKRAGKKSQQANDFLAPLPPTIGTAINVGIGRAYNNGAAIVNFTTDPTYPVTSVTATSNPGNYTATANSVSIVSATGGTETTYSSGGIDYKVHSFTSTGDSNFTIASGGDVDYFILAGGGGGGGAPGDTGGGGGGAGGYLTGSFTNIAAGAYTITVGAGGGGGNVSTAQADNGGNSVFNGQTAIGGGGGDSGNSTGANGGSGGGPNGTGTAGQGFGAPGTRGSERGGRGGGGAGSEPDTLGYNFAQGSTGGQPIYNSLRTGSAVAYAGGGGGGNGYASPVNGGLGGNGGGGGAGDGNGGSATANSGGGGGGGTDDVEGSGIGGSGGSGIVVIRYKTSPSVTVTGLQSDTAYTFNVTATNTYGTSNASAASNSITATTVPATPSAPTASSPNADQDQISWSAPANGGSSITNYHWESNDGKSGDTATTTSASLAQEAGTAQRYRVYATNDNGNSDYSALSNEITTTFSFVPFGVFGFSPFQVFGFSPFAVFGFSPFNVFGFSPFRVFGFSPFRVFGFSPACISEDTPVLTKNGYKKAKTIVEGDILLVKIFDELPIGNTSEIASWFNKSELNNYKTIESTVTKIDTKIVNETIMFNNDPNSRFSMMEDIFVIREGVHKFIPSREVQIGDKVITNDSVLTIENVEIVNENKTVYDFHRNPVGLVVANDILCYNAYPILQ